MSRIAQKKFENGFTENGWRSERLQENHPIKLFKLHGSLDWFDDNGAFGVSSFKFPRHTNAEDFPDDLRPLLIFGTNHKLSAREPFLSLAYHFSQCILKTPVLAIVGYSFGDSYINEIIEQGFRTNSRLKIVVIAPKAEEKIKERPLFCDSPRVTVINKGAKVALNDSVLLSAIRELLQESLEEEPF